MKTAQLMTEDFAGDRTPEPASHTPPRADATVTLLPVGASLTARAATEPRPALSRRAALVVWARRQAGEWTLNAISIGIILLA